MIAAFLLALAFPPPEPARDSRPARTVGDLAAGFPGPEDGFMLRLQSLCGGKVYEGRVVSNDPQDGEMRRSELAMGPADCTLEGDILTAIAIPFTVGEDRSRTWLLARTPSGVSLRHRHLHEDGTEDALSAYGGEAQGGTFSRQAFPADAATHALFDAEGIPESAANVWAIEIAPGDGFAYEMKRPGREFRAEFDLSEPVSTD